MGGQDPRGHAERRRQGERHQGAEDGGGQSRPSVDGPQHLQRRRLWGDFQLLFSLVQMQEGKIMERRKKIALELSELVVYCRPVPFDEDSKSWRKGVMGWTWEKMGWG